MLRTVASPNEKYSSQLTTRSKWYQRASATYVRTAKLAPSWYRYNLTACHDPAFLWFRVAKVGTRTIMKILTDSSLQLSAEHTFRCYYPVQRYQDHFKFGFVRNPWDRIVSCWHNKVVRYNRFGFDEETREKYTDFSCFLDYVESLDISTCDPHMRLQSRLIDLNNVDFVGRFENFRDDLSTVLDRLGLSDAELPHENTSSRKKDYREYYNDELIQRVGDIYQRDIQIFNFQFE